MLEQQIARGLIETINLLKSFSLQTGKSMRWMFKLEIRAGALKLVVNLFSQKMRASESHHSALV